VFHGRVQGRWFFVALILVTFAVPAVLPVHAASSDTFETGVAQSHQLYRSGEPEIAVDPVHPMNLIYVATKFKRHFLPETGTEVPNEATLFTEWAWGSGTMSCSLHVSRDYGTTWLEEPFPVAPWPGCSDPMAAAGPDGTLYVAFDRQGSQFQDNLPYGTEADVAVSRSTDDGKTWSLPVGTGTPIDRPMFRVDQKTGWLWENSGFDAGCATSMPCGRVLAYSRDKGDHWTQVNHPLTAYETPPPPLPGGVYPPGSEPFPGGGHFAVYDNIVATAIAPTAPSGNQPAQPAQLCVLKLSPTDPTTGTYHCTEIPGTTGMTGDTGLDGPLISADPTKTGRFAVALKSADEASFKEFVTENAGADNPTWSGPTTVDTPNSTDPASPGPSIVSTVGAGKPWFDYSQTGSGSSGLLGLMWKARNPTTGLLNVYSVVSTDNGATFSQPKKVNSASFPQERSTDGPGDDLSWIAFGPDHNGETNAYIGWGDTRNGDVEGWFGRVPVTSYSR
jgi:hypothetical protein